MEELEEDPTFDETPMCYERMALWLCNVLRRRDRSRLDVMKLWKVFEHVMRIGHASAWSKQEGHNCWGRCDASFEQLGSCIDEFLESTAEL